MFYKVAKLVLFICYSIVYRINVQGRENIPKSGAVILCANHTSNHDPIVLALALKRKVNYLAKKELFENKVFARILTALGGIPVDRQKPAMSTFKDVLKVLEGGNILGLFAQGTRMESLDADSAKSGVALFAIKSGTDVVPINIKASYKIFSKINIVIGKPISLYEYADKKVKTDTLNQITKKIMLEVAQLEVS